MKVYSIIRTESGEKQIRSQCELKDYLQIHTKIRTKTKYNDFHVANSNW